MKKNQLLLEGDYKMYKTLVYLEFNEDQNITHLSQIIRGLRYVAVVANMTDKNDPLPRGLLSIKAVTLKPGIETFRLIQQEALKLVPGIRKFKFSEKRLIEVEHY